MKDLWVDFLCWSSGLKILSLSCRIPFRRLYYLNRARSFYPFYIRLLEKAIRVPVIRVDWIMEAEERIGDTSLYESIRIKMEEILEGWLRGEGLTGKIRTFCGKNGYNPVKYREHLRAHAYGHLFRPVEIMIISEKISGEGSSIYLFRRTPFARVLRSISKAEDTYFYRAAMLSKSGIVGREGYFYDIYYKEKYFFRRIECIWSCWLSWFQVTFNSLFYFLWEKVSGAKSSVEDIKANIGVEFIQSRVKLDVINDIYWFKDSGIDPNSVCGIELEAYDDESSRALSSLGIKRCKIYKNPLRLISFIASGRLNNLPYRPVSPELRDCLKVFPDILRLFFCLFRWDEGGWIVYQQAYYRFQVSYWESVYRQLGLRIIWSMFDIDNYKLAKSQAIELLGGLYIGSHWSNSAFCYAEDSKRYDVLFAWGQHFIENILNTFPYMEAFQTGYPLDFYFKDKRPEALELRKRYPGKFILSYHDNAMANDIPFTKNMQLGIHKMLISMIESNDNLVVFLKPKRKRYLDMIIKELPDLGRYIDKGKIEVFLGDTPRTKAPPAKVAMASDLVIGLGISGAASESYFAGAVSFHADLTGYARNAFSNKGLNTVVFRDIQSLKKAIEARISGENSLTHQDYRKYYDMLDPFQDGKAYIRTGFIIKHLQKAFREGLSRETAVKRARSEYEIFLEKSGTMDEPERREREALV